MEAQVCGFLDDRQLNHVCHSPCQAPASSTRWVWPGDPLGSPSAPVHSPWVVRGPWDIIHGSLKPSSGFSLYLESSETHLYGRRLRVTQLCCPSSAATPLPLPMAVFFLLFLPAFVPAVPLPGTPPRQPFLNPSGQSPTMTPWVLPCSPMLKAEILPHCLPWFLIVSCLFPPHPSLAICN